MMLQMAFFAISLEQLGRFQKFLLYMKTCTMYMFTYSYHFQNLIRELCGKVVNDKIWFAFGFQLFVCKHVLFIGHKYYNIPVPDAFGKKRGAGRAKAVS